MANGRSKDLAAFEAKWGGSSANAWVGREMRPVKPAPAAQQGRNLPAPHPSAQSADTFPQGGRLGEQGSSRKSTVDLAAFEAKWGANSANAWVGRELGPARAPTVARITPDVAGQTNDIGKKQAGIQEDNPGGFKHFLNWSQKQTELKNERAALTRAAWRGDAGAAEALERNRAEMEALPSFGEELSTAYDTWRTQKDALAEKKTTPADDGGRLTDNERSAMVRDAWEMWQRGDESWRTAAQALAADKAARAGDPTLIERVQSWGPGLADTMEGSLGLFWEMLWDPEVNVEEARRNDAIYSAQMARAAQGTQAAAAAQVLAGRAQRELEAHPASKVYTPEESAALEQYVQGSRELERATQGLDGTAGFAAKAATSMAQNVPAMALAPIPVVGPAASLGLMGAMAAGSEAAERSLQGEKAIDARHRGWTSGMIESATEILPVGNMAEIVTTGAGKAFLRRTMGEMAESGGTGAVRFLFNLLSQGGSEAAEEGVGLVANYIVDVANNDPNAEFSLKELIESAALGFVSGAGFGALGTGLNAAGRAISARQAQANGNDTAGMTVPAGTDVPGGSTLAAQTGAAQQTTMSDSEKEEELYQLYIGQQETSQDSTAADGSKTAVPQAETVQQPTEAVQQQSAMSDSEKEELFRLLMGQETPQDTTEQATPRGYAAQTAAPKASEDLPDAGTADVNIWDAVQAGGDAQQAPRNVEQIRQVMAEVAGGMETYTDGMKQALQDGYRGQEPIAYVQAVNGMYNAGRTGSLTWEQALEANRTVAQEINDPALLRRAFALGQQSVQAETVADAPLGTPERGGTVQYGKGVNAVNAPLPNALTQAIASKLKMDIDVVRQLTDGDGREVNAHFNAGLVRLTVSSGSRNAAQSMYHDVEHYIGSANPKGWAKLKNEMLSFYAGTHGMDITQKRLLDRYAQSYGGAKIGADEAARDLWAGVLSSEYGTTRFCEYVNGDESISNAEKRTILQTLRDILDMVLEHLRRLLRSGDATVGAAEGRRLAEQAETSGRCRELLDDFIAELEIARQNYARQTEPYDIKKPFAEQIYDAIHGRMPAEGNDILVGRAPKVFQDIGLGTLPLTMTWRHANTVYYASAEEAVKGNPAFIPKPKEEDDYHGMRNKIYDIPEKLADPIAIIKSRSRSDSSVVVIVDETDNYKNKKNGFNGNRVIGAITIGTTGNINRVEIDSDRVASYYGRKKNQAIKIFAEALTNEKAGDPWILYMDKERAKTTLKNHSIQFAARQKGRDSSNNTIQQNQNNVNKNAMTAEENLQKKIQDALNAIDRMDVDENGILHKVNEIVQKRRIFEMITDTRQFRNFFGSSKAVDKNGKPLVLYTGASTTQIAEGDDLSGVYLKTKQSSGQEVVYASIRNPLRVANRDDLRKYLKRDAQYRRLMAEGKEQQARDRATEYLKGRRFDGVHLLNDGSGAEVWIAFADNQIKSAIDNVGTFDPRVNDRYYSRPVTD